MKSKTSSLEEAYRRQCLWPPIHAAVDVYLKRRGARADSYELIWRLIHIWECVSITLAQASVARIRESEGHSNDFLAVREKAFGLSRSDAASTIEKRGLGALDGSVDKWIEILEYISTVDSGGSPFLANLITFLTAGETEEEKPNTLPVDLMPLVAAWGTVCDVPTSVPKGDTTPRRALRAVNIFRNRFAHVPFPYDILDEIRVCYERCTEQLFGTPPIPNSPLIGCIAYSGCIIKGTQSFRDDTIGGGPEPHYVYDYKKGVEPEIWNAAPFVFVDNMFRPYVLTRLRDSAGLWEYTRYLAEANAVQTLRAPALLGHLPRPSPEEYAPAGGAERTSLQGQTVAIPEAASSPPVTDMVQALQAIRSHKYVGAIQYLQKLVVERPDYPIACLRLGQARRELAVSLQSTSDPADPKARQQYESLLHQSLRDLERAMAHGDRYYRAEACYQYSKTTYELWQITGDQTFQAQAVEEAHRAESTYPEERFVTWVEFISGLND